MIEIEQDHHVAAVLDQALGLLDHHLGDLHVARRRLVEGGRHHLALHRALHVGHFFRPLVDQQHDQEAFRMVRRDRVRDILQQHGLAGARRRDDERALALADRGHDVDDARGHVLLGWVLVLHLEPLVGIERRQVVEVDLVARLLRVLEVDGVDLEQREIALALLRAPDLAFDGVAGAQAEAADLRGRDVDVVRARQVVRFRRAQEAEAVGEHLDDALADDVGFADRKLLEDAEHQLLLAHGGGVFDLELFGERDELARALGLEVLELHFPHAGNPGDGGDCVRKSANRREEEGDCRSLGGGLRPSGPMLRPIPTPGSELDASACVRGDLRKIGKDFSRRK